MLGRMLFLEDEGGTPTPCPALKAPAIGAIGQYAALLSPIDSKAYVTWPILGSMPAEQGSEFPPCDDPLATTPRKDDWTFTITDDADVEWPKHGSDPTFGGAAKVYYFECEDVGPAMAMRLYLTTSISNDYASVDVVVADPYSVCPPA